MHIDTLTLMLPSALALALAGLMLGGAYFHLKGQVSLLWWAVGCLINAVGLVFLVIGMSRHDVASLTTASFLVSIAPPLFWAGIRAFNNRRPYLSAMLAGPLLWAICGPVMRIFGIDLGNWSTAVEFAIWPVYLIAAAGELLLQRDERLTYRWPLGGILALHAMAYVGGVHDVLSGVLLLDQPPALLTWFGVVHFETMLFAIGCAVMLPMLVRERMTLDAVRQANIDPLTGTPNRRVFFEGAERLYQRCSLDGAPLSVAMFDLDHFKRINDTMGHATGDRVLVGFADILRSCLRPNDIFGRYGGEEFVVALPNVSVEAAYAIAERMRLAFSSAYVYLDGRPVNLTVSVGVAAVIPGEQTVEAGIQAADGALYIAKNTGRNRVVRADGFPDGTGKSDIVRIA